MDESEDFKVKFLTNLDYLHFFHAVIDFLSNSEAFDFENYLKTQIPKKEEILFLKLAQSMNSELSHYYKTNKLRIKADIFNSI